MKKLILAILATGTIASTYAQAGSILVYGNAGYSSVTDTMKGNQRNWNVNPGVGYQINNCFTIGLNFGFGETSMKPDNGTRTIENNYEVGPFVRFAHPIAHSRIFSYYSQLNLGYMGGYTTAGSIPSYDRYSGFGGSIFPAIGANVGHGLALNFSIGGISYATTSYTGESNHVNNFNVTLGQQVNIGVSKNFGGHRHNMHHEPGEDMHRDTMDKDSDNDNGDDNSDDSNSGKHHHRHHKKSKDTDTDDSSN